MGKKKRKKRQKEKKEEKKPRKNLKIVLAVLVFVLIGIYLFSASTGSSKWSLSEEGLIEYPQKRGKPVYALTPVEEGEDYVLKKAVFESKGAEIYSLIFMPKSDEKGPGLVIAPGAGPTKESRIEMARFLADLGFASIILDQRTFGETGGTIANFQEDMAFMAQGIEPDQHKMVYDILVAYDVIKDQKEVDASRVILIGESMGGRFSIIAGALDSSIDGVIGISTGGYGTHTSQKTSLTPEQLKFLASVDPDSYISRISPRRVVMLHYDNDEIIPLEVALNTYNQAKEPKKFHLLQGNGHGYYEEIDGYLEEELKNWDW
ncbi:MAG: alpha/beta hydrolase [Candidatus Hydrothermarchaeales archaeon]